MVILIIATIGLILIDQLSKLYFELSYSVNDTTVLIKKFLYFTKTYNTGAAWSSFSDSTFFLALLSLAASVVIGMILYKTYNLKTKKLYTSALILMLAGTAGNLIDRFMVTFKARDGVVDFIGVYLGSYEFPVFNLADSFLVVGVILLFVDILFFEDKRKQKALNEAEPIEEESSEEIDEDI